jgi:hypothetical protein
MADARKTTSGVPTKTSQVQFYSYNWNMPLLEDRPHHGRRVESCSETRRCTNTPNAAVDQFITAHQGYVRASVCGREYRHIADAKDEISAELRDLLGEVMKTRRSRAPHLCTGWEETN